MAITLTQPVLAELASRGAAVLVCDAARLPAGMILPLDAHSTQTQRMRDQLELTEPRKKRLWQQVVRAKITLQAELLRRRGASSSKLTELAKQVRSGDPDNIEAQAARYYWTALFGPGFRRDREAGGQNAALNYGYAVVRAAVARAVCGAGLHPTIGLHHHNRSNAFCLADDLMEPFRPAVDQAVARAFPVGEPHAEEPRNGDTHGSLDRSARAAMLAVLTGDLVVAGETRTVFDGIARAASSLARAISDRNSRLLLPESLFAAGSAAGPGAGSPRRPARLDRSPPTQSGEIDRAG